MNAKASKAKSRTDWEKLETMSDEEIDLSDIPELDATFFKRARPFTFGNPPDSVQLDEDVLSWFKAHSRNYQKRINRVLRQYIQNES
jgi:uncharacterized protein (DUF4415 family)